MEHTSPHAAPAEPGLIGSVTGIVKNAFSLVINRVELAALEFSALGVNVAKVAALGGLALIGAWFAVAYWSALIVVLAWDSLGWKILLIMAIVFTALVVGLLWAAKNMVDNGKLTLPATLAELRADRDALL